MGFCNLPLAATSSALSFSTTIEPSTTESGFLGSVAKVGNVLASELTTSTDSNSVLPKFAISTWKEAL